MDLFAKIDKAMQADLGQYAQVAEGEFTFPKLEGDIGPHMHFKGQQMLVWSINDYLGLANHPEVRQTDAEAAQRYGLAAPMGSRMLTGNTDLHERLEQECADFMEREAAYLLNYGYQGVASIVQALANPKDAIVYDQLSHACLIDGMLMSRAKRFVFRHNDMTQLAERLQQAEAYVAQSGGGILVITEGVFGMKGDLGNLPAIAELKQRYNFRLLVDDAHGFGVMGARGQGTGEHFGVHQAIDVLFCTFAKSMALIGAFVAADQRVIQYLRYNLRSQIYAKSLPYPIVAGALKRLALLRDGAERRHQLWSVARQLQEGLIERGFEIGPTQSPVTPVYMDGTAEEAGALTQDLRHTYGLFVSVVTYPVIERGKMILRMIPTANHTAEDVAATLAAFSAVAERKRQGYYAAAAADPA